MADIRSVGDLGLLRLFDGDLRDANARALALAARIRQCGFQEIADLVPGARSLLVLLRPGSEPPDDLHVVLETNPEPAPSGGAPVHEIPVRYGGQDLATVAETTGLSPTQVADLHSEPLYTVGFVGFSPGFAYLIGLPEALHTPRLATPRQKVPAGSVGIGGAFTGIYPRATPGGWNLIGNTDVELFDPARDDPALLKPGDRVRFIQA